MRSTSQTGEKWFTCDRCGGEYPVSYRTFQNGLAVCTVRPCYDKPGGQEQEEDPRVLRFTDSEVLDARR